jgi:hypothetical protein
VRSRTSSLPPPVGGLNARDSLADMKPEDAILLDNWFPRATEVEVRSGFSSHATFTGSCETVVVYNGRSSTKLFVCVNTTNDLIIDATSGGAISSAVVGSSGPTVQAITSSRWDYVNYPTAGGNYLSMVNATDTALEYDGTTWSTATLTHADLASTDDLFTNAVYAERIWYGEKDSFNTYYLPVRTKSGAMTKLNVGSLFKLGGYLSNIVTVTDSTDTLTDYIGFVSSEGEVIAYEGTDPSSASTWAMAAHFQIGRPVCKGQRAWTKLGADALIVTVDGVVSLRSAIATDRAENASSISGKIRRLVNEDVTVHGSRFGWAAVVHPAGQKLIINVPTLESSTSRQYVMNTETKAWCRFTGWNAFCWAATRDKVYWGGSGKIVRADYGMEDGADVSIVAEARQAYSYFGSRGRTKQIHLMRPIIAINGPTEFGVSIDTDYEEGAAPTQSTISGSGSDPWGGIWSATWTQALSVYRNWFSVAGEGFAIAPRVKATTLDGQLLWSATDFVHDTGQGL